MKRTTHLIYKFITNSMSCNGKSLKNTAQHVCTIVFFHRDTRGSLSPGQNYWDLGKKGNMSSSKKDTKKPGPGENLSNGRNKDFDPGVQSNMSYYFTRVG